MENIYLVNSDFNNATPFLIATSPLEAAKIYIQCYRSDYYDCLTSIRSNKTENKFSFTKLVWIPDFRKFQDRTFSMMIIPVSISIPKRVCKKTRIKL